MKSTLKFFAAAFAIVAAAACSKEYDDNLSIELETKHITISASHESQTKTLLGVENWANWSDDDAICLFYEDKDGFLYLNDDVLSIDPTSNDNDPTKAIFSGNATVAKNNYAAYPSSGWQAKSNMYLEFQGLNSQVATKNSFDPKKHIALSVDSKDNHFFFQNACALLKVTVGFDNVYSIKVDGSISELGFGIPFTFRPGKLDINGFSYYIGNYNPTITLSNADPTIPLENGATYYIVVPHTTVSDFKVSLSDEKGNIIYSKKKASNFTIERNKIYDLGILKKEPPKVGDYFYSNGTYSTELDKSKTPVGVIFYTGDPTEDDSTLKRDYPDCTHGLVVGLTAGNGNWMSGNQKVYEWAVSNGYHTTQQFTYSGRLSENENSQHMWGYNNTHAIRSYTKAHGLNSGIVDFVDSYNVKVEGASPWYIPSVAEMKLIRQSSLKSLVESLGGDSLSKTAYYMSAEENDANYIPTMNFATGAYSDGGKKTSVSNVCPIFAF